MITLVFDVVSEVKTFLEQGCCSIAQAKAEGRQTLGLLASVQEQFDDVTLPFVLDDIIVGGAKPVNIQFELS